MNLARKCSIMNKMLQLRTLRGASCIYMCVSSVPSVCRAFLASSLDDCHVKICKFTAFSSGSFCQIYRVTDEALVAKTAVWPNSFLMNVFFALKGSKLLITIS